MDEKRISDEEAKKVVLDKKRAKKILLKLKEYIECEYSDMVYIFGASLLELNAIQEEMIVKKLSENKFIGYLNFFNTLDLIGIIFDEKGEVLQISEIY